MALARPCQAPSAEQQRKFLIAADERPARTGVLSLEPALCVREADDAERGDRCRDPLERLRPQCLELKHRSDQPAGGWGDQDPARPSKRLEARRDVWSLADNGFLLRGADADPVTNDNQARGDTHSACQGLAVGSQHAGHGLGCGERSSDRPLGLVLVRSGPAEIGEHTIAHQLGNAALETIDGASRGALVGEEQLTHVLRIEPRRKLSRADEVDEHDRELAALGLCAARRGALRRWTRGPQSGDRREQGAAVTDRAHAEIRKVPGGQLGEDSFGDIVVAEARLVLPEPERPEPGSDVHARLPEVPWQTARPTVYRERSPGCEASMIRARRRSGLDQSPYQNVSGR